MFIKWSIFGFLAKRHYVETQYKQSVLDDADSFAQLQPAASPVTLQSLRKQWIQEERMGMDERHLSTEPNDNITLSQILVDIKKKTLLEFLQNPDIGIHDKRMVAEQVDGRDISPNITNGGLFQDWDFVL